MSLKKLSMRSKLIWFAAVAAVAVALALSDAGDADPPGDGGPATSGVTTPGDVATTGGVGTARAADAPRILAPTRSEREVTIVDQGLGMPISTVRVPKGWDLQHDIAVDPNTGRHARFKLVIVGPRNQYIRSYLGNFPYGNFNGVPFERAVRQAVEHVLGVEKLERLQVGSLAPNPRMVTEDPAVAAMAQRLASRGQRLEMYTAGFTGERGGRSYQGEIIFTNMVNPAGGFGVLAPGAATFGLTEDFAEMQRVAEAIRRSTVRNPEHDRAMTSINERLRQQSDTYSRQMMDQSVIAHQRRMADQKAAFASHQRNMAGLNQLQDVAHESYMKTLRSRGSFASVGSDYGGQQAVVDQIHGRSSFTDPWTNSQVALDGQYKYNFTNGLGDYYRTNDASFEPASLQGDWRKIDPLGP